MSFGHIKLKTMQVGNMNHLNSSSDVIQSLKQDPKTQAATFHNQLENMTTVFNQQTQVVGPSMPSPSNVATKADQPVEDGGVNLTESSNVLYFPLPGTGN